MMLATTYSPLTSTIGSRRLNCRVRNENGCGPPDKSPASYARFLRLRRRTNMQIGSTFNIAVTIIRCDIQSSAQKSGHISTSRLNALLRFHLKPINLVIF